MHEAIGITSFGLACGTGNPGVATRISAYIDWIEDIVWLGGNGTGVALPPIEKPIDIVSQLANRTFVKSKISQNDIYHRWTKKI